MPEQGNQNHQRENAAMNREGNHLGPAEVFVLRPNVLHPHGLAGKVRWRKLRREEKLPDASAKSAEIRSPGYRQAAVHRSFRNRTRAEKILKIVENARAKYRLHERRARAVRHFHGTLRQKLLKVRPKIVGNQELRSAKSGDRRRRY